MKTIHDKMVTMNTLITGKCRCKDGWIGETCQQKCPEGFYGRSCNASCGCIPCHHETGDCQCSPGLTEPDCGLGEGFFGSIFWLLRVISTFI